MDRADLIPLAAPGPDPIDERDHKERREPQLLACRRAAEQRRRQREVDLAEKAGRLMPYGDAYVAGTYPFDPF